MLLDSVIKDFYLNEIKAFLGQKLSEKGAGYFQRQNGEFLSPAEAINKLFDEGFDQVPLEINQAHHLLLYSEQIENYARGFKALLQQEVSMNRLIINVEDDLAIIKHLIRSQDISVPEHIVKAYEQYPKLVAQSESRYYQGVLSNPSSSSQVTPRSSNPLNSQAPSTIASSAISDGPPVVAAYRPAHVQSSMAHSEQHQASPAFSKEADLKTIEDFVDYFDKTADGLNFLDRYELMLNEDNHQIIKSIVESQEDNIIDMIPNEVLAAYYRIEFDEYADSSTLRPS